MSYLIKKVTGIGALALVAALAVPAMAAADAPDITGAQASVAGNTVTIYLKDGSKIQKNEDRKQKLNSRGSNKVEVSSDFELK